MKEYCFVFGADYNALGAHLCVCVINYCWRHHHVMAEMPSFAVTLSDVALYIMARCASFMSLAEFL